MNNAKEKILPASKHRRIIQSNCDVVKCCVSSNVSNNSAHPQKSATECPSKEMLSEKSPPKPSSNVNINSRRVSNRNELNAIINNDNFWKHHAIVNSPADGHCLIHSLSTSLRSQTNIRMDKTSMLDKLFNECEINQQQYVHAFDGMDLFKKQRDKYIANGIYNALFGDTVPDIIANVLQICLVMIYKRNGVYDCNVSMKEDLTHNPPIVFISKHGKHYNAIVCTAVGPYTSSRYTYNTFPNSDQNTSSDS